MPYLDIERCYDCRLCIPACPFGAVQVLHPA
ncbi:MAG: 4Fe-4S binding protein [Chloroflexota bacterium]